MKIAVVKETMTGERRVALVPGSVAQLQKAGCEVLVECQAGESAGFLDAEYEEKGATIVDNELFRNNFAMFPRPLWERAG